MRQDCASDYNPWFQPGGHWASQGELPGSSTDFGVWPRCLQHLINTSHKCYQDSSPCPRNLVSMSPQVPCRLRAARSQTKASTSVWRPTLQAHATRPPPTCMCEVRTRALQCGPCLQGAELPLLAVDTWGLPSPGSFSASFCSCHSSSSSSAL